MGKKAKEIKAGSKRVNGVEIQTRLTKNGSEAVCLWGDSKRKEDLPGKIIPQHLRTHV